MDAIRCVVTSLAGRASCPIRQLVRIASRRGRGTAGLLLAASFGMALAGCAEDGVGPARLPVSGKVSLDGKPLAKGTITFSPLNGNLGAVGEVADGEFRIGSGEGPPAGRYQVEIVAVEATGRSVPNPDFPQETVEELRNMIPPRYNVRSQLAADVKPGADNGFQFELSSRTMTTSRSRRRGAGGASPDIVPAFRSAERSPALPGSRTDGAARRRNFLRAAISLATIVVSTAPVLAGAESAATEPARESKSRRPNILIIAADDLNDWVGFLKGHPQARTPNLDRLAGRGTVFTRAYCAAPACNPSRTALLTGVRPSTSGVYHNNQPWRPVLRDAVTLPQAFTAAGYDVAGGGKIFHNSYNDKASWPRWYGHKAGDFPAPENRPVNGIANTAHFDWGPIDVDDAAIGDTKLVSWAIDYLHESHDRPFFLAVGLIKPHLPWYVPRKYFDLFPLASIQRPLVRTDDLDDIPSSGRAIARPDGDHRKVVAAGQWDKAVQGYLASIAYADAQIGRLLDALEASPHAKDTIIVLWGDHGWHLGQKEHWRKFALWEEATRTSFVIAAPGVTAPGSRSGRTVSLMDIYPTLVELAGLPPRDGLEAHSLVPLLKDPKATWDHPVVTTHGRNNHAVRTERWRYIRYADGSEELYDHDSDPREWTNLASEPRWTSVKAELAHSLPALNAPDAPRVRERGE